MKKALLALTIAAAVASGAAPAGARKAESPDRPAKGYGGQWIVIGGNQDGNKQLEDFLEDCGIRLDTIIDKICPGWPGSNPSVPETSPQETMPEATEPETTVPETSAPAPTEPETSAPTQPEIPAPTEPETTVPETSKPEKPTVPETDAGDSQVHPYVQRIVDLVNAERAKAGLNPVALDLTASKAAQVRAKEIVTSFSHTRPDGTSFTTALTDQGIRYRLAGENIAWGQRSPEQVMEGWMNSSGHRANILRESFTHIGVGYYQLNGTNYWAQLFFQ